MKKLLSLTILFIMACFALTGCGSSAVVPEVKVRWSGSSSETLVYDVRLASDYELTYSNYYSRAKNSEDRKSTRLNSSHSTSSRMPSSA